MIQRLQRRVHVTNRMMKARMKACKGAKKIQWNDNQTYQTDNTDLKLTFVWTTRFLLIVPVDFK